MKAVKPNTLDELLTVLPGLRRLRSLNADLLRVLLDRRKGECTWCGTAIGKRRQTWCGQPCIDAFKLRCCGETARRAVLARDGGTCRACGRDTLAAEAEYRAIEAEMRRNYQLPGGWRERAAILTPIKERLGFGRGHWREVDHDPPVVEYGGLAPVEQLRLLCGACHAAATKELAGRRAST